MAKTPSFGKDNKKTIHSALPTKQQRKPNTSTPRKFPAVQANKSGGVSISRDKRK